MQIEVKGNWECKLMVVIIAIILLISFDGRKRSLKIYISSRTSTKRETFLNPMVLSFITLDSIIKGCLFLTPSYHLSVLLLKFCLK